MARYSDKTLLNRHQIKAIGNALRHFADRCDHLASLMTPGTQEIIETTHFKTLLKALNDIRKWVNGSMAAHEGSLIKHVTGDILSAEAFKELSGAVVRDEQLEAALRGNESDHIAEPTQLSPPSRKALKDAVDAAETPSSGQAERQPTVSRKKKKYKRQGH